MDIVANLIIRTVRCSIDERGAVGVLGLSLSLWIHLECAGNPVRIRVDLSRRECLLSARKAHNMFLFLQIIQVCAWWECAWIWEDCVELDEILCWAIE